jgi:Carboxypeptidase regulatory-like domain/TonB dependent receptor
MHAIRVCVRAVFVLMLAGALAPSSAHAQSAAAAGQIVGLVFDQSGAAIVGVDVSARNTQTNYARSTRTDEAGRYALAQMPLGDYEITAQGAGLQLSAQEAVVTLGGSTTVNFDLRVDGIAESVDVTAPTLDRSTTLSKSVLTDLQLQDLPASGRRIRSMFLLTPATQIEPECGGFAISGQKGLFTNVNVDGGDYTNTHWCGHVEFSPSFTMEAIEEFQVLRSTFSAEYGRSTGGIINLATKSGANATSGTSFYLFRNDATTKKDPFDRVAIGNGNQFGGSIGGAIKKDKTFYFVASEFQHNTKPVQVAYTVLDALNVRNVPGAQELLRVAPEEQLTALSQSESMVLRIDHRLGNRSTLMGRFDYIRNRVTDNVGGITMTQGLGADSITNRALSNAALLTNRNDVTGMGQMTTVLSHKLVNETRLEVVREFRPWNTNASGPEVTVRHGGATVAIYGPQATGLAYGNIGYRFTDRRYQVIDNLSLVTGAHTTKFGVDANLLNGRTTFNPGSNGIYTFNTLEDYLARRPFSYQQFAGTGAVNASIDQIALYAQDEWRVAPGVTISPGLRYEMALLPDNVNATVPQNRFPLATRIPDDKELIAPRLGLAWDVGNRGKTVIRAASGLFFAAPYMPVFEQSILTNGGNPELSSQVLINATGNPNAVIDAFNRFGYNLPSAPLGSLPTFTNAQLNQVVAPENRIGQTVNYIDPNFRLPRAVHMRVAAEHELARGVMTSIDFTKINTARIARVRNINLTPPTPDATGRPIYSTARPYPSYGFVQVTEPSARSRYSGTTAAFNVKRARYTMDLYYTLSWSYSHDDSERGISGIVFDDAYNLANEYNYSNIDERHQFAANGMFFAPEELEISASARFNSGRPFSAQAGTDLNRDGVIRDRPVINGRVIPRNTFRNTGYSNIDLRVQRGFHVANSSSRLIVSLELFNVFDFDNVEIGSANFVYGPGTVLQNGVLASAPIPATFGKTKDANGNYLRNSTLRTAPFQAQFGVRYQF